MDAEEHSKVTLELEELNGVLEALEEADVELNVLATEVMTLASGWEQRRKARLSRYFSRISDAVMHSFGVIAGARPVSSDGTAVWEPAATNEALEELDLPWEDISGGERPEMAASGGRSGPGTSRVGSETRLEASRVAYPDGSEVVAGGSEMGSRTVGRRVTPEEQQREKAQAAERARLARMRGAARARAGKGVKRRGR